MPVIWFIDGGSADASADRVRAFRKGLAETGYVEGRNITVEYHWLEGQYDRLPALTADLVQRYRCAALRLEPSAAEQLCTSWQLCSAVTMACSDALRSSESDP
jgi:hypothetical protein